MQFEPKGGGLAALLLLARVADLAGDGKVKEDAVPFPNQLQLVRSLPHLASEVHKAADLLHSNSKRASENCVLLAHAL